MKRIMFAVAAAMLGWSRSAMAQLVMQMGNGWNFTISGNVNAFGIYTSGSIDNFGPALPSGTPRIQGGLVPEEQITRIRTGLLPSFIIFDLKGNELGFDLGVHFGFAPQIQSPGSHDAFGAQIDMRQVYMTVGGTWGQVLAGRELGLYQRHNILTDLTLFGAGPTGGGVGAGGTTLGRIGFGYLYPNFNAQVTYSTKPGEAQISIGLFQPSVLGSGGYTFTSITTFLVCKYPKSPACIAGIQAKDNPNVKFKGDWNQAMGADPGQVIGKRANAKPFDTFSTEVH